MWIVLFPVIGAGAVGVGGAAHEGSVAQGLVFVVDREVDLLGHALVGLIDGGEPAAVVLGFALRPDLRRLGFVFVARVDEEQPLVARDGRAAATFGGGRHVVEHQIDLFGAGVLLVELNGDLLVVVVVLQFAPTGQGHFVELKSLRIQGDATGREKVGLQFQVCHSDHLFFFPVEAQVEFGVQQVDLAVGGGVVHRQGKFLRSFHIHRFFGTHRERIHVADLDLFGDHGLLTTAGGQYQQGKEIPAGSQKLSHRSFGKFFQKSA